MVNVDRVPYPRTIPDGTDSGDAALGWNYEVDPFVCPKCQRVMAVVSIIEDPKDIQNRRLCGTVAEQDIISKSRFIWLFMRGIISGFVELKLSHNFLSYGTASIGTKQGLTAVADQFYSFPCRRYRKF